MVGPVIGSVVVSPVNGRLGVVAAAQEVGGPEAGRQLYAVRLAPEAPPILPAAPAAPVAAAGRDAARAPAGRVDLYA